MNHIEMLRDMRVFKKDSNSDVDLVKTLDDGTRQIIKVDMDEAVTPNRCLELLRKSEKRSGVDKLDRITMMASLWLFDDKEAFLEANRLGFAEELNPVNILKDVYEFTESDGLLTLTRWHGVDAPIAYLYDSDAPEKGFYRTDSNFNLSGDVLIPHLSYEQACVTSSK